MQFGEEFVLIPSEALTRVKVGIEAADESFIIGAQSRNDGGDTRFDLFGVLRFEVVVEQDDYGQRKGFGREKLDALFDVVVEDAKFVASKIGNETALAVFYGDREKNVVYGEFQRGLAVGLILVGGRLCVLRLDRWWRGRILRNLGNRSRRRILRGKAGGRHQNSRSE